MYYQLYNYVVCTISYFIISTLISTILSYHVICTINHSILSIAPSPIISWYLYYHSYQIGTKCPLDHICGRGGLASRECGKNKNLAPLNLEKAPHEIFLLYKLYRQIFNTVDEDY